MAKTILSLQNLSKYYTSPSSVVVGLDHVNLNFSEGEFVAVTGESGSGKSTLAHILGGILPYENGEMLLCGKPTSHYDGTDWEHYRRDSVSFISQSYGILPGATVSANVSAALRLSGMNRAESVKRAEEILRRVDLWELRSRRAAKLSSGQKQRLSIARALAKPSSVLIADEPTGNLDSENSARVVRLLAEAAKERLVLIITHDYAEVADLVTRHITLQDGKVVMDAHIRDEIPAGESPAAAAPSAPARETAQKRNDRKLGAFIAGFQMRTRPVWCVIMALFFTLTAFSVFVFLGTFLSSLDDTSTRIYDPKAFFNGDPRRIVVMRQDGAAFTDEDYRAVMSVSHVSEAEKYGYLADFICGYREKVDYFTEHKLVPINPNAMDPEYYDKPYLSFPDGVEEPAAKTLPMVAGRADLLTAGRLPERFDEIVAVGGKERLGEKIDLYLRQTRRWGVSYFHIEATVVGVTDYGEGIYLSDLVGRSVSSMLLLSSDSSFFEGGKLLGIDYDLPANTFLAQEYSYAEGLLIGRTAGDYATLTRIGNHDSTLASYIQVPPDIYDRFVIGGNCNQVSLTISDYAYTDRVLNALHQQGYLALSPFREGSTKIDGDLAAERLETLLVSLAALVAILALQLVILRAMFGMENEGYRLLNNIGLTCRIAKRSVLWQVLIFTVLGQAVGFAGILLCRRMGIRRILDMTKFLQAKDVLLLSLVHLAASLLASLWIMHALKVNVYPFTEREDDLKEDGEEAEA